MSAFVATFRFEFLRLWASRIAPCILLLGAALALYALNTGIRHAEHLQAATVESLQDRAEALETFRREAAEAARAPSGAAPPGTDAFAVAGDHLMALPMKPAAVLSVGQSDLLPAVLGAGVMNAARLPADRYGFDNPVHLMTGKFDLTAFILLIAPLLVIALSFDLMSGERERGVLTLVLSQPVSLASLLFGKLAARASLVLAVTLAVPLGGLAFLRPDAFSDTAGIGIWTLLVVLYVGVWFAASACLALGRTRSAMNALVLIGVWLALVTVLPALLQIAAVLRHPVPTRIEAVMASRENPRDYFPAIPELARAWYARHPELATPAHNAESVAESFSAGLFLVQEDMDRQAAATNARIEGELAKQQSSVAALSFLSPSIALKQGFNTLAGTDTARYQVFRLQADAFRSRWREHFAAPILHGLPLKEADYAAFPVFAFAEPRAEERAAVARALGVLAGWLGLLVLVAVLRARRFALLA